MIELLKSYPMIIVAFCITIISCISIITYGIFKIFEVNNIYKYKKDD